MAGASGSVGSAPGLDSVLETKIIRLGSAASFLLREIRDISTMQGMPERAAAEDSQPQKVALWLILSDEAVMKRTLFRTECLAGPLLASKICTWLDSANSRVLGKHFLVREKALLILLVSLRRCARNADGVSGSSSSRVDAFPLSRTDTASIEDSDCNALVRGLSGRVGSTWLDWESVYMPPPDSSLDWEVIDGFRFTDGVVVLPGRSRYPIVHEVWLPRSLVSAWFAASRMFPEEFVPDPLVQKQGYRLKVVQSIHSLLDAQASGVVFVRRQSLILRNFRSKGLNPLLALPTLTTSRKQWAVCAWRVGRRGLDLRFETVGPLRFAVMTGTPMHMTSPIRMALEAVDQCSAMSLLGQALHPEAAIQELRRAVEHADTGGEFVYMDGNAGMGVAALAVMMMVGSRFVHGGSSEILEKARVAHRAGWNLAEDRFVLTSHRREDVARLAQGVCTLNLFFLSITCNYFSIQRVSETSQEEEDYVLSTVLQALQIIVLLEPRAMVLENVADIKEDRWIGFWGRLNAVLESLCVFSTYHFSSVVSCPSVTLSSPVRRRRIWITGLREL